DLQLQFILLPRDLPKGKTLIGGRKSQIASVLNLKCSNLRFATSNSFFCHKGISVIRRRHEVFFDGAGADPPQQIHHRTSFIVSSTGPGSAKRLLADDGTGWLVINIKVTGCKAQRTMSFRNGLAVG